MARFGPKPKQCERAPPEILHLFRPECDKLAIKAWKSGDRFNSIKDCAFFYDVPFSSLRTWLNGNNRLQHYKRGPPEIPRLPRDGRGKPAVIPLKSRISIPREIDSP
jgi:hypothetical protein